MQPPAAPAANATKAAAPASGAKKTTSTKSAAAAPKDPKAKKEKTVSRAPKASEVLGLDAGDGKRGEVAAFLRPPEGRTGPNPLFAGNPAKPSGAYAGMKIRTINVSPIERHWGAAHDKKVKPKTVAKSGVLSLSDDQDGGILTSNKDKAAAADKEKGKSATAGKSSERFELLMYKLDRKTGHVETFKRAFTTKEARDSAAKFAAMSGYSETAPSKELLDKIRNKARAAKQAEEAKKVAEQAKKKAKEKEEAKKKECAFRATWYVGSGESRTSKSQCFDSQASLNAFMAARQKAAQNSKKTPEATPKPKSKDSLAPVKLN